jgi:hypothetical protein
MKLARRKRPVVVSRCRFGLRLAFTVLASASTPISSGAWMTAPQETNDPLALVEAGDYLKAWNAASLAASSAKAPEWASYNLQLINSYVRGSSPRYRAPSDEPADCRSFNRASRDFPPSGSAPLEKIVSAAVKARVVVLNENHFEPRHRAFAFQLAKALKAVGYDAIAVEALNNLNDANAATENTFSVHEGPVDLGSGLLTAEPAFARFLNLSKNAGFRLVAYEYSGNGAEKISTREEAQATALSKYLKAFPQSKILVYVGYSHVAERPLPNGKGAPELWMAGRLKAVLGTDIVTVDQTYKGYEACQRRSSNGDGQRKPFTIVSDPKVGRYRDVVDFQVLHRRATLSGGRPTWLAELDLAPLPVDGALENRREQSLLQVFALPRSETAVPVDQILVRRGEHAPTLMAPRGPYEIVRRTK